jgi:alginate O-acetyltransferase complex protein AlgI
VLSLKSRNGVVLLWLTALSLFFYAYWNPPYLALLAASIGANYLVGRRLGETRGKTLLILGVAFNLGLIAIFKYAGFFVSTVNTLSGAGLPSPDVVLPLAISFFTFQQIAYLVDTYQGKVKDTDFIHYALFVSFFPQLIAGPIVHHNEIIPQFENKKERGIRLADLAAGVSIFVIGLQKKVVIADGMGVYSDAVFNAGSDPTFFTAWAGALAYTFQIYFDFSGYSDMAIGLARIFGITLPENFASPYKAVNIVDFWRRWHMTLSRFLKDYLYVPLGGNRRGIPRRYVNIMITMLLGGLWHGAGWTFVFWGGLHGFYIVVNHFWHFVRRRMGHDLARSTLGGRIAGRGLTFLGVVVAWVFFRVETWENAVAMLKGMVGVNGIVLPDQFASLEWLAPLGVTFSETVSYNTNLVIWFAALLAVVFLMPNTREIVTEARGTPAALLSLRMAWLVPTVCVFGGIGLLIVIAKADQANEFIYMVF